MESLPPRLSSKIYKRILLLRHGEIQKATEEKRFIGQIDIPLSEKGRKQAQWWHKYLLNIPLTEIFASDLDRCQETAKIIGTNRPISIKAVTGLREIDLGKWDGLLIKQVREKYFSEFRERGIRIDSFRPPDGESFLDLKKRIIPVFETLISESDKYLLIVTHAGVIRTIICHILDISMKNILRLSQDYAAMNIIDLIDDNYRVQGLNLRPEI